MCYNITFEGQGKICKKNFNINYENYKKKSWNIISKTIQCISLLLDCRDSQIFGVVHRIIENINSTLFEQ